MNIIKLPPKISIITVCLNADRTIEETIKSIVYNDYPNIEYIIIDGGSRDNTINIIKKYEKYIAYWVSEKDQGISDAFNKGIMRATGQIIGIISADDLLLQGALDLVKQAYMETQDVDVIYGNAVVLDANQMPKFIVKADKEFSRMLVRMPLQHSATFVISATYKKYGTFNLNLKLAMDYDLILRFITSGAKFCYLNNALTAYSTSGVSSKYYVSSMSEAREISIKFGLPRWRAELRYWSVCSKLKIKEILNCLSCNCLIDWYRQHSSRFKSC